MQYPLSSQKLFFLLLHPYLIVALFAFSNTRPLGTCRVHVKARAERGFLGNGGAKLQPGVRVRFDLLGMVHYAHLAAGRTMRLP